MSTGIDDTLDFHTALVDLLGRFRVTDDWNVHLASDVTADDSDKSIVVTTDYEWIIQSIFVDYTSTSTSGNRQLTIEIQDNAANVLAVIKAGVVQAASLQRYYSFAPGMTDMAAFVDTSYLNTPLPNFLLDEAYVIRVYDSAAIAVAADDMEVFIVVKRKIKEA